ncbi:MAG: NAD-dependent epimerase/dehydratase family protein [Deltaproteobacteria bacterium]|nr:MAG: NAD-dependent epimerase/dehydratase family protein [Deltaproteobacteria bacterium]
MAAMRVLVTGATGFIGRRLVGRLRDEGVDVRALALPDEPAGGLGPVEVVRGDVVDAGSVRAAVRGVGCVYHLAAVVTDWGDEDVFRRVNVDGTRNVIDAAADAGCGRVVVASSIVCYGTGLLGDVCDEVATPREYGIGPYSRTKREAEEVALDAHAFGRVPVAVVRPGNVWGPGSRLWVGEIVSALRRGLAPLIDGGAGDAALAYVDNVVDVLVRAGRADDAPGRIYNAADGEGITWRQYLDDLARAAGVPPPRRSIPAAAATVAASALERLWRVRRRADRPLLTREAALLLRSRARVAIDRARRDLGYEPLVRYRDGMARVARALQDNQ